MANEARPCACDIGDRMEYGSLGEEVQIEHVKAYLVKPEAKTDKAVIVIQDIYGWQLPNTRYMADMIASNGYITICPDFFLGKEPWNPSSDWSTFQEWLEDKKSTNINKEVDVVLKYLKEQIGAKKIGVVGFCWGGVATHHIALQYPEVKAGVSVYGIVKEREDRYQLKYPTLFIFGENDTVIPLDQVTTLEAKLNEKCTVDFKVKIYPNQTHGFVHRKREDVNPTDRPQIQEAREDMITWLNKFDMKSKELSLPVKQSIIKLKNENKSIREIAKTLGVAKSTIWSILKKAEHTGDLMNNHRSGRPRKTTEGDDRRILSLVKKNPFTTVGQIKNTLEEVGVSVSESTIKRRLQQSDCRWTSRNLRERRAKQKLKKAKNNEIKFECPETTSCEPKEETTSLTKSVEETVKEEKNDCS